MNKPLPPRPHWDRLHRATLHDGRLAACKLQYPDMQSAVEADLSQLHVLLGLFERYDPTISTRHIQAEIGDRLREELDYEREAKHIALYRDMLADTPGVHLPEVIPDLSTKRLLTMTWLQGDKIMNVLENDIESRNALALNMFRAWYVPFYYYGVIHGDPHLGNYSVTPENGINLMDFGCIRVFRPHFVKGVIDLYTALETDDAELAESAYRSWGFPNLTKELVDVLNVWARFLYGPHSGRPRPQDRRNPEQRPAPRNRRKSPCRATAGGRRGGAARIRIHGSRRRGARVRVHAFEG